MSVLSFLEKKIRGKGLKIVFPEGEDERVLGAAIRHRHRGLLTPILIGNKDHIVAVADDLGMDVNDVEIIDPDNYAHFDDMVVKFVERRKGKVDEEKARVILKDPNYFGTMLVYLGYADGMVSGAAHTTGDTVRPALQIIKMKEGVSLVSGAMIMISPEGHKYLFADTAINIAPNAEQIAEIAYISRETAETFEITPNIAMLSFSTMGSAHSPEQEKMAEATRIAKERYPELNVDGEMQFDAALVPVVAKQKAPNSSVAGNAQVFIFPDLQSGNIGYKIGQRFGHFEAIGPILQGLAKPVNDLSRGCDEEDAYKLAIITAAQAIAPEDSTI